ncbi:MAG: hypothetical protein HQL31_11885 [Planctomycetes bacterium]|nr:hypothetical protein [Planctomycetota bacterium]
MSENKDIVIHYFDGALPEVIAEAEGEVSRVAVMGHRLSGNNPFRHNIFELGVHIFEIQKSPARFVKSIARQRWFNDPGGDLPDYVFERAEVSREEVEGQSIDGEALQKLLEGIEVIIAHDAGALRPFMEKILPELEKSLFGCSRNQVDWRSKGFESRSLHYLSRDHGWWFENDSSLAECAAIVKLLNEEDDESGRSYLDELIGRCQEPLIEVEAKATPRDRRLLSKEFFKFSPRDQVWYRVMGESTLKRVRATLENRGFEGELREKERLPATERFRRDF